MDIAFVSNVVYPYVTGGAQKRIHEIGTRLTNKGHKVTVYGRHFWDGPTEITKDGLTLRAAAPAAELYQEEGRRSITEAIDFATRLAPILRRRINEHDLVVASVFPYFPVLSSKIASLGTDTPVVTTWHEVWRDYWDDYLGVLAPGGKIIEHLTARVPQHPIAVSGITADRLAEIGPSQDEIEVIHNGIDVNQIQSAPIPKTPYRADGGFGFDVLFAGRLIADKRVDVLLNAFDRVAAQHEITLGIIGDGPEADRLRKQASTLNHTSQVIFLGFLDEYENVLGHMRAADVFASPSTREGFGITYAEAMAANCTVIAADHPESAAGEVVENAGYLTEPTVDGVASALGHALNNERPVQSPTKRAEKFDWDRVAARAETVYRNTLKS
ncbi:glycosyltransferase family 4 protein [Haladaptatus sp. NG-SE-30]